MKKMCWRGLIQVRFEFGFVQRVGDATRFIPRKQAGGFG